MRFRLSSICAAVLVAFLASFLATPAAAEGHVFRHSDTCSNSFVKATYNYVHWITKKDGPDVVEPLSVTVTVTPKNGAELKIVVIDPKGGSFEQRNLAGGKQQMTILFDPSVNAGTFHTASKVVYAHDSYYSAEDTMTGKCPSTS